MNAPGIFTAPALRILTDQGPKVIYEFEQRGPFAVYRSMGNPGRWTVGHIASGCAVTLALPSRAAAIDLIEKLDGQPFDWSFTDAFDVKAWPKAKKKAIHELISLAVSS